MNFLMKTSTTSLVIMVFILVNKMLSEVSYFLSFSMKMVSPMLLKDGISVIMMMITLWISLSIFVLNMKNSLNMILISMVFSLLFFMTNNWLVFFMMFELTMVPMLWGIISTGNQPERLSAFSYLFFYTAMASVPLLIWILMISSEEMSPYISSYLWEINMGDSMNGFWKWLPWVAFFVKMPLFGVHSWLLKAHVEASMSGSMFLAGVLLKFGSYGAMRIIPYSFLSDKTSMFTPIIMGVGLTGSVYMSLMASISSDIKLCVAYASVSHMSLSLVILVFLKALSMKGFTIIMMSHSLVASGLFMSVSKLYESKGSRSILILKSSLWYSAILGMAYFMCWSANMNIPPLVGFIGEVVTFTFFSSKYTVCLILLGMYFFFSSFYSIFMAILTSHSEGSSMSPITMGDFIFIMKNMIYIMSQTGLFITM